MRQIVAMRWLEEIRLRTQPRREKEVMEVLQEIVDSVDEKVGLESAAVYSHRDQPGGFSVILGWETASAPARGSDTAILILEGIKTLGLLDHIVMVEKGKSANNKH